MGIDAGPLLFALIIGVFLASGVAWIVAGLYRRRMLQLMRGGPAPDDRRALEPPSDALPDAALQGDASPPGASFPGASPSAVLSVASPMPGSAHNRRAVRRHLLAMSALCTLIGITQSWLALLFVYPGDTFSLNRLLVLGLVYAWPMVIAWSLLLRWSWPRLTGAIIAYMGVMAVVVMLSSDQDQTLPAVGAWLGQVVAIPIIVALLIGASGRIRAVAPYLLPVFVLLSAASVFALALLAGALEHEPEWLRLLVGALGAEFTLLLVVLAPWLVLAWPVYAGARRLAQAYRNKRFSDLGYLFAAYWLVILTASTLPALQAVGLIGLTQLLPWLWLPLADRALRRRLAPPAGKPPTLLVLRVFQQDARVGQLFDRVVERWRLSGTVVLIAGTDLISRTLDADDLFTFVNRRLAERFIASEAQLAARIRGFDRIADPDGRFRVNECYCFDTTWQAALAALVREADVVLMDLRGFRAENRGCRHELGVLADAGHVHRVILLHDRTTARDVAARDIGGAPAGRFVWVEAGRLGNAETNAVLRALFDERPGTILAHPA